MKSLENAQFNPEEILSIGNYSDIHAEWIPIFFSRLIDWEDNG